MTKEEYDLSVSQLRQERIKTLNIYNIEIGDIIYDGFCTIMVEEIRYDQGFYSGCNILEFRGSLMTKKLTLRKDRTIGHILQDEDLRHEITIIKKHIGL